MYYFVSVLFMLLCAKSNLLADYTASYFVLDVILIWIGLEKKRFKRSDFRLFLVFGIGYLVFVTARYFLLNTLSIDYYVSDLNFLVKYVLLSFLYCAVLRDKAIYYIVRVTVLGALISLPLYVLQLFAGDLIYSLGKSAGFQPAEVPASYVNLLYFTYDKIHDIQNSGFSWEPGAFGCFLDMGLLLYFLINDFVFGKGAWILVIAVITTLSTTSYVALLVVLLFYYRGRGGKLSKYLLIGVPVILVAATQLPFLFDKIVGTYNEDLQDLARFADLNDYYTEYGGQLHLNRFASVIFLYQTFGVKLLWGISNSYPDAVPALKNVNISNGLIDFIAKFGVVGLVFLLVDYIRLFKRFFLRNELIFYCVLVLLLLSFGEPMLILQTTLVFFFLYHYYDEADEDLDTEDDEDLDLEDDDDPNIEDDKHLIPAGAGGTSVEFLKDKYYS